MHVVGLIQFEFESNYDNVALKKKEDDGGGANNCTVIQAPAALAAGKLFLVGDFSLQHIWACSAN